MQQLIQAVLQAAIVQHAGFESRFADHGRVEVPNLASACSWLVLTMTNRYCAVHKTCVIP
jgi:hypothetical protein